METTYKTITLESNGPVGRLTLARPEKLNALDARMLDELLDAIALLRDDDDLHTVVLRGAGRAFCAGVDVESPFFFSHATGEDRDAYAATRSLNRQHRLIEALAGLPHLTIAAVNGDAIGGAGFGMAMACDLRYAVRTARFRMVPGMLDVIQDFGLTWLLQQKIGAARTLQLAILGDIVTAEDGERLGFVELVTDDVVGLDRELTSLIERLSTVGTDVLRMLKLMVRSGRDTTLAEQLGLEAVANGLNAHSGGFGNKREAYVGGLQRRGGG